MEIHTASKWTVTTDQLTVHVNICRRTKERRLLHEANKTPVCIDLILYLSQDWCKQVRHALSVAINRVSHGIVQQDVPEIYQHLQNTPRQNTVSVILQARQCKWQIC